MTEYHVQKPDSYNRLRQYLSKNDAKPEWNGNRLITKDYTFIIADKYVRYLERDIPRPEETNIKDLIYGKDPTEKITAVEVIDDKLYLFKAGKEPEIRDFKYWFLSKRAITGSQKLDGTLDYKYINYFTDKEELFDAKKTVWRDQYSVFDDAESAMILSGVTLFKGMQISDVSVLSFDIESEGLLNDDFEPLSDNPEIYMISNTYRDREGNITRKSFYLEEYETTADMIECWCEWVQEIDPDIMLGHNIFGYDLPYLNYMYRKACDLDMPLGKNWKGIQVNSKFSKFRKDGSQTYDYKNIKIFGRQVIDTFFLSIKYDLGRNYPSYGLKAIIEYEGLEKEGRIKWDFVKNPPRKVYEERETNPELYEQFKEYCCFAPKSSLISMHDSSVKWIEDVQIGDKVITHEGTSEYVYDKLERNYEGELLSFNVVGGRKIHRVTPEHPFLVLNEQKVEYEWKKAKDIQVNDLLVIGQKNKVPNRFSNYSSKKMWLFGFFQGDGYVRIQKNTRYPVLTCHVDELKKITNHLDSMKLKYSIINPKTRTTKARQIVITNSKLGDEFLNWSGGKFTNKDKKCGEDFFNIVNSNKECFMNFLAGLIDADGHVRKQKNGKGYQMGMGLVSPNLINIVDLCCASHGINITRQNFRTRNKLGDPLPNGRKIVKVNMFYEITFFKESLIKINKYLYLKKRDDLNIETEDTSFKKHVRVKEKQKELYKGKVYNISVTNSNSYISNGLVSHNCDDGDDSLKLFDLMAPSFFYYTQSIPKTFQAINNGATGSQINSFLVRSYLQHGHSIPEKSEKVSFQGAISAGITGIHDDVCKVDVASLYPSIMIQYKVYDAEKDPKAHFLKMVKYFTKERLENKKKGKDTGDRYFKDMEQAQKIVINSAYGMLGATGLNFNSPQNAAYVTEQGREILQIGVEWASGHRFISVPKKNKNGTFQTNDNGEIKTEWKLGEEYTDEGKGWEIVNCDTDSFSYKKGYAVSKEEFDRDIEELNSLYPENIIWEDDGQFEKVIVVKAKNYVLKSQGKVKYKGSSLTDQKKEPALIEFLQNMIGLILRDADKSEMVELYDNYVREAYNISDIKRWVVKKTITKAIFENERKQEADVREAISGRKYSEGDKVWLYTYPAGQRQKVVKGEPQFFKKTGEPKMEDITGLKLVEDWDGNYDKMHYVKRVYSTLEILSNVLDIKSFTKYSLAANIRKLEDLVK